MQLNTKTTTAQRLAQGNMLLLCIAMFGIIIIVVSLAFGVYFLFSSQKTLQHRCESFALKAAQQLNINDYAGKLNNLQARSRELVFAARQMSQTTEGEELGEFAPLAAQVLNQSRDGARLVDSQRQMFVGLSIAGLRTLANKEILPQEAGKQVANMSTFHPQIVQLTVGKLANLASNVEANEGQPELFEYDLQKGYIQRGKQLNLYRGAVNLKLPGEDGDLDFVLAPLPAPVKGTLAPLRLTAGTAFKSTLILRKDGEDTTSTCKLSPSAVQVTMTMRAKENILTELQSTTKTTSTACTNGAAPEPRSPFN
jgi:hypothetical protein